MPTNLQEWSETHIWLGFDKKKVGGESLGFLVYYGTRTQLAKNCSSKVAYPTLFYVAHLRPLLQTPHYYV
jgi:hypothetical protein